MGKADGLSRRADWKVGMDKDNENQIFIKDHWIRSMYEVVVEGPEVEVVEKIKKARNKDKDVVRVVEEIKRAGVKKLRGNEWKIEGDLVLKEGKIYVPKDEELLPPKLNSLPLDVVLIVLFTYKVLNKL